MRRISILILLAIVITAGFLRFYQLAHNPPSPYWEEVAIGYDAYSILKTGKDFHGRPFPAVAFESFGDWKPSIYFYASALSIAIFGLNVFAVRFVSAFAGVLTIIVVYFLTKELLGREKSKDQDLIALLASLLLAISPWHLQLSRVGFEANLGLFFVVLGAYCFMVGLRRHWFWLLAAVSWVVSLYTYHGERIFVPLLALAFGAWFLKKICLGKKWAIGGILIFLFGFLPILIQSNTPIIKQRFAETSAFATLEPILKSNRAIKEDKDSRLSRVIHHRYLFYADIFAKNYLDHFRFDFLFLKGDYNNYRHSTQKTGCLYLVELPFLLLGIYFIFRKKKWSLIPLLFWLVLSPIPAAITKASPHGLRSLPLLVPITIIAAFGFKEALAVVKEKVKDKAFMVIAAVVMLLGILAVETTRYLFIYHRDYPFVSSQHWQYGYQEMIDYVRKNQDNYDQIYMTRNLGRPSTYYWFYTQTNPSLVQKVNEKVLKDQGEYLEFGKIRFYLPENDLSGKKVMVVLVPGESFSGNLLKDVKGLDGGTVFKIYEN